ncbi:MAG: TonB family protein [Bacteroidetes bacterium]|nr:MAG: TonB family protein [Bacteroidota bacterium]
MKNTLMLFLCSALSIVAYTQDFIPSQPVGGRQQLKYFIDQELIYPAALLESGKEGTVTIKYIIDTKGQIEHISFKDSEFPDFNREILRIFRMTEWEPATLRSIPVADSGHYEYEFNIRKYNRLCRQRGYTSHFYPFEPTDTSGIIHLYKNLETAPYPIFTNDKINLAGFIAANLVYPEAAIKQNVSGVVKIAFVVEPHGRISNTKIVNSLGAGCNEEAIRIIRIMKWMPGTINRQAVRARMSISINFSLDQGPDGNFNPNIKSSYGG